MKRIVHALWLVACLALPAFADVALPAGVTKVTSVEGITEYGLANGLRILFAPDSSKPSTTINTTYMVGSRHENYGETGMAHLLEHLVFKGSPNFSGGFGEMSRRGLRANGSTWTDRTNYFASFAVNDENLDWYLRWSAEAMTKSFIAKKDLDTEMTVVRNEMEMGENSPFRSTYGRVLATAYSWHGYGKDTIGARADVENVDIERLQAFYRTYYQPDNAVLIVSGKFDEAKTLAIIAREFGKIPRPTRKLPMLYTIDPEQQGERSVTVRRVGDTQLAMAVYHVPAGPDPDFAAVEILQRVMGDTPSGRLHKALVETHKAASVFGFAPAWHDPTFVLFGAELPAAGNLDAAREALVSTVESTLAQPVTAEEVSRARTKYLKDFELTVADPERIGVALSTAIGEGDWRLFFLLRDRVRTVKLADVQRVAASYLMPANRTLGLYIPTSEPQRPPKPVFADVGPMVKDYKGDPPVAVGEAFDATPANIESRTTRSELPNGMRIALMPKRTRAEAVNEQMVLHFGDEKSLQGTWPAGSGAAAMINRGAAGMTRSQIQDRFDELKARVTFDGDEERLTVAMQTTRANLPEVMKLVAAILRKPDFPASELDVVKNERITALENARKDPESLADNALVRHGNPYPKGDVRYEPSFDEEIEATKSLGLDRVRAFHAAFYGAGAAQFAAVGDFDAEALRKQLAALFGDWKSAKPYKRVPKPLYAAPPADLRLETPDKANAYFTARVHFPLRDDAPDYPAAMVANRIVGGGTNSILWKRIREKEGVSYGTTSGLRASSYDSHGVWTVESIYAPQNVKRLEDAFSQELGRATREGFTADELKDGRNGLLLQRKLQLAQDNAVAGMLVSQLELGRTMDYQAGIDRAIEGVTLEQVSSTFRKYVNPDSLVKVYAGDWKKATATTPK